MARIAVSVDIEATADAVWAAIEHVERHVEWMADAEAIRFLGERRRGLGTDFVCDTRVGPFTTRDRMTVIEWEPGRAMGVRHRGLVSGVGRFTLEPLPSGGTRFSWAETLHFPARGGGPVTGLLARPVLRALWRRNLRRLKRMIEGGAPGTPAG